MPSAPPPAAPAGLLRRLGAMVYDGLLVLALWMFTLFPLVAASNDAVFGPFVRSLLFLEAYAFFAFFWMKRGQTLGMLAWHLELRNDRPGPFTLSQATLRFVGGLLSWAALGLGYLWIWSNRERRGWPDLMSASRMRHAPGTRRATRAAATTPLN